jgi:hypothetical protein
MKHDRNGRSPVGSALNFGARSAQRPKGQQLHAVQLQVADAPSKAQADERGNDPYNTSGSFDRTKNWARIGKR